MGKEEHTRPKKFYWNDGLIDKLIDLRYEKVKELKEAGLELTVQNLWSDVPLRLGLFKQITADQACKKWNQLLKKYKDIELKLEKGTCNWEEKSWSHSDRIREILEVQWTFEKPPQDSEFDLLQQAWDESNGKYCSKNLKSSTWEFFDRLNRKYAQCKLCDKKLSYRSSISNLKKHLRLKHGTVHLNLQFSEEVEIVPDVDMEGGGNDDAHPYNDDDVADPDFQPDKADLLKLACKVIGLKNKGPRKSPIWRLFVKIDDSYAQCKLCKNTFCYFHTISNLKKHLSKKHPSDFEKLSCPDELETACESILEENNINENTSINLDKPFEKEDPSIVQLAWKEMQNKPKKPKIRSNVWEQFDYIDKNLARCKICKKTLRHSSSITNLKKHVRLKHPSQFANLAYPEELKGPPKSMELGSEDNDEDGNAGDDGANDGCDDSNDDIGDKNKENLDENKEKRDENDANEDRSVVPVKPSENENGEISPSKPINMKNRHSKVWDYFTALDHCSARCNVCKDTFSYKSTTSNLKKHYLNMHSKNRKKIGCMAKRRKNDDSSSDSEDGDSGAPVASDNDDPWEKTTTTNKQQISPTNPTNFTDALRASKGKQPPGAKESYLWNFFTYIDKTFAECDICNQKLVYKSGLSNLARHQRIKHPLPSQAQASKNGPSIEYPTIQITDIHGADSLEEMEKTSRKYSYVWNFFTDLGNKIAQCKVCKKPLCYKTSLTNLMKHRRIKHPQEPNFRIEERDGVKVIVDHNVRDDFKCRPTSKLWQFFKYLNDEYAECKVCFKQLSHRYTTSNLLSHKNKQHPDVPLDHFPPDPPLPGESADKPTEDSQDSNDCHDNNNDGGGSDSDTPKNDPKPKPDVLRRKSERSPIWKMFDRIDNTFSKCKFCNRLLSHRSTNTNLTKHVKKKHPDVFAKFSTLKNSVNAMVNHFFPEPTDDTSAAVSTIIPAATTSADAPQEIQIIIDGNQQSFEYGNVSSYTLPIIYIQDEENPNNMKVVHTGEMFASSTAQVTTTTFSESDSAAQVITTTANSALDPATTYFHINGNNVPIPTNLLNRTQNAQAMPAENPAPNAASGDLNVNDYGPQVQMECDNVDEGNAQVPTTSSNSSENNVSSSAFLNINGNTVQLPTRTVASTPTKVGENTVQVPATPPSNNGQITHFKNTPTAYITINGNNVQLPTSPFNNVQIQTTPSKALQVSPNHNAGQTPTAYLNFNGNTVQLPTGFLTSSLQPTTANLPSNMSGSPAKVEQSVTSEFLMSQLEMSNKMMQEMQRSIDRQNEMILRLAESLGKKGQEDMPTD